MFFGARTTASHKGKGKSKGKERGLVGKGHGTYGMPSVGSHFQNAGGGSSRYSSHFRHLYDLEYAAEKEQIRERTRAHTAQELQVHGQCVSGLKARLHHDPDPRKPVKVRLRFPSPPPAEKKFTMPPRKANKAMYEALSAAMDAPGLTIQKDVWSGQMSLQQCVLLTISGQPPVKALLVAGAEVVVTKKIKRQPLPYLSEIGTGRCILVSDASLKEVNPDGAVYAEVDTVSREEIWVKLTEASILPTAQNDRYRIDVGPNKIAYDLIKSVLEAIGASSVTSMNLGVLSGGSRLGQALLDDAPQRALEAMKIEPMKRQPSKNIVLSSLAAQAAEPQQRPWKLMGKVPSQATWLNETQGLVRRRACERPKLQLVQGPPGTGKTALALEVICSWLRNGDGPVLATAFSNQGADNLAEGLHSLGVKVVRVGSNERDLPCGFDAMFAKYTNKMYYLRESRKEYDANGPGMKGKGKGKGKAGFSKGENRASWDIYEEGSHFEEMVKFLRGCDVVCATCIGVGMSMLNAREGPLAFPCVAVDEAAQIIEPAVLLPIARGSQQIAMFGDQCQLPATVLSQQADQLGLGVSMFARLINTGCEAIMLDIQYRMHAAIASYPAAEFYAGRLRNGVNDANRASKALHSLLPDPLSFVQCDGHEVVHGRSKANQVEAQCVNFFVKQLIHQGTKWWDIGIITPYAGQVAAIQQELRATSGDSWYVADAVSTVDSYQGSECEVVLLSMVRANKSGNVGFLADWRRMNVALTRCKKRCVVIGHMPTLLAAGTTDVWLRWVEHYASRPEGGLNVVQWTGSSLSRLSPSSDAAQSMMQIAPEAATLWEARQPTQGSKGKRGKGKNA